MSWLKKVMEPVGEIAQMLAKGLSKNIVSEFVGKYLEGGIRIDCPQSRALNITDRVCSFLTSSCINE